MESSYRMFKSFFAKFKRRPPPPLDCESPKVKCVSVNAEIEKIANALKRHEPLECQICYKTYTSYRLLSCGHQFHMECINIWLSKKSTCPLCRETVS